MKSVWAPVWLSSVLRSTATTDATPTAMNSGRSAASGLRRLSKRLSANRRTRTRYTGLVLVSTTTSAAADQMAKARGFTDVTAVAVAQRGDARVPVGQRRPRAEIGRAHV